MDNRLLELLVCPVCKGPLQYRRPPIDPVEELVCQADQLAFAVHDGIPVMIEAQARDLRDPAPADGSESP
jgi:uncharacterized protein YbaR (Trm112 family)